MNKIDFKIGKAYLILMSIIFYVAGDWISAVVMCMSIITNYIFSIIIKKTKRKLFLGFGIGINVFGLFYFKYSNFIFETITGHTLSSIILPLGVSFYTFQQIMYLVEVYKNNDFCVKISDYLSYVLYFPKILMGPLVDPSNLITQINDKQLKKINWDNIAYGIKIFSYGLFSVDVYKRQH